METISHYWIVANPDLTTTLHMAPRPEPVESSCALKLYQHNGELINELSLEFSKCKPTSVEFEPLMAACPIESGFRHAHLALQSSSDAEHLCRLYTGDHCSLMAATSMVSKDAPFFLCKDFGPGTISFLCLVNPEEVEMELIIRVIAGNRSPEIECTLPALGSKMIHLESEFEEICEMATKKMIPSYVRVRTKTDGYVGVQLLDQYELESGMMYRAVV